MKHPVYPLFSTYFGYTLLELLVVLLIFSLLAGVALPRLTSMYGSMQRAYERDEILAQLASLNYVAFQQGRDIELTTFPPTTIKTEDDELTVPQEQTNYQMQPIKKSNNYLNLPTSWQIETKSPIMFFANGACSGGEIVLTYQAQPPLAMTVKMNPPFCQPELSNT
jgi:prepilin-type N-terminal cleavage/methylation domain-containing protein